MLQVEAPSSDHRSESVDVNDELRMIDSILPKRPGWNTNRTGGYIVIHIMQADCERHQIQNRSALAIGLGLVTLLADDDVLQITSLINTCKIRET